jgi:hypothetical protein
MGAEDSLCWWDVLAEDKVAAVRRRCGQAVRVASGDPGCRAGRRRAKTIYMNEKAVNDSGQNTAGESLTTIIRWAPGVVQAAPGVIPGLIRAVAPDGSVRRIVFSGD